MKENRVSEEFPWEATQRTGFFPLNQSNDYPLPLKESLGKDSFHLSVFSEEHGECSMTVCSIHLTWKCSSSYMWILFVDIEWYIITSYKHGYIYTVYIQYICIHISHLHISYIHIIIYIYTSYIYYIYTYHTYIYIYILYMEPWL